MWAPAPPDGSNDQLMDISLVSSTNVWAVGQRDIGSNATPIVYHFHGGKWNRTATSDTARLSGVAMMSDGRGFAVGGTTSPRVRGPHSAALSLTSKVGETSGKSQVLVVPTGFQPVSPP